MYGASYSAFNAIWMAAACNAALAAPMEDANLDMRRYIRDRMDRP